MRRDVPAESLAGLVMVCDVDVDVPDATRTHTIEVARAFLLEGTDVDLVARGANPGVGGRYWRGRGNDANRITRLLSLNLLALRVLISRRDTARRLYVRHRWSLLPTVLAGRALGYRVVLQVDDLPYGPGYDYPISRTIDWIQQLATRLAGKVSHGVVAVTPQLKQLLVDYFGFQYDRVCVLPNGVDTDAVTPRSRREAIERLGLDSTLAYVVFCGHFAGWVDFSTMVKSFALVARQRPEARLVLVGDGAERGRVEDLVAALRVDERVILTGALRNRDEVARYIAASTVALAAHSLRYCARIGVSPLKVAEYLAAGRAVVAIDVPGLHESLSDSGAALLVPASPEAMASAILDLLDSDVADSVGREGRRLAERRYSWREIARRSLALYEATT